MDWKWIVAIALAVLISIIATYIIIKRSYNANKSVTIDSIVGKNCTVTETIDNFAGCGQISVCGQLWSARGVFEDDVFEKGETLRIVAIEGVKAVCKRK